MPRLWRLPEREWQGLVRVLQMKPAQQAPEPRVQEQREPKLPEPPWREQPAQFQ